MKHLWLHTTVLESEDTRRATADAQDAARYRWLAQWAQGYDRDSDGLGLWYVHVPVPELGLAHSLDEAIDAAIAAQRAQEVRNDDGLPRV